MNSYSQQSIRLQALRLRAQAGDTSVLDHPDADTIIDEEGNSALHWLAEAGCAEVAHHPLATTLKNSWGETPLDILREVKVFMGSEGP